MIEIFFASILCLFLGAASVYLFSRKRIDELNKTLSEAEKTISVKDTELKLLAESSAEKLEFKNEMLKEVSVSVKDTTREEQKPYMDELIKERQRLKDEASKIEKQKSENELMEREILRMQAEANIKREYSTAVRGLNCQQTMERIIISSGYEVGKSVLFDKTTEGISGRPDAQLIYPGGRKIMIDAKAPLAQFDSIIEAGQKGDEERIKKLKTEFGKKIIDHIDWLSGRKYETAKNAEDYVLMFLPSAVHEQMARESVNLFQKDLDEYARNKKIYVVGPSTLTPYVQTASALWQMHENTIVAEDSLRLVRRAFKASRILIEKIITNKRQMKTAYQGADELEKSFNSTFQRVVDEVLSNGYEDDNVIKIRKLQEKEDI